MLTQKPKKVNRLFKKPPMENITEFDDLIYATNKTSP